MEQRAAVTRPHSATLQSAVCCVPNASFTYTLRMKFRLTLVSSLLIAACHSAPDRASSHSVMAAQSVDNAWVYLADKYDRDGDGQVTQAEYRREGGEFGKLDRNDDGVLNAQDYPVASAPSMGRGWNDIPAETKQRMGSVYSARAVLLTYWQPDPQGESLHRDDMLAVFDQLDSNHSEDLDESEFACATDSMPWGGPGKAWPLLLAAVDAPGNGDHRLGRDEMLTYHGKFANQEGVARGAPSGSPNRGQQELASDGAPVGVLAPDFQLEPLGGGEPVRLADYRAVSPVALIFGSYT